MHPTTLDQEIPLNQAQIDFYQIHRFLKVPQVFSPEEIAWAKGHIARKVTELSSQHDPLDQRDTYGKAFLQIFNLWRTDAAIRRFIFSKRLAKIAADLLQVEGVRMYHDQALFKEAGGGITPWHADQYYWPLDTDKTVTAWIPLQATPLEMGPLEFSAGSHRIVEGRELMIGDESEAQIGTRLKVTDFAHVIEPFELGEVSFHSGWVFHRAGANQTDQVRQVMTVIFMDRDIRLKAPTNANQQNDWDTWCPSAKIGEVIDTPLNPVMWERATPLDIS
ncbi:MAG: phytanoyl-CoA dioxygenase family protein [Bacteroidota bacterium]